MGARKRSFANNLTTSGVLQAAAINNASLSGITDVPSGVKGKLTLISTQTASSDSTISFTTDLTSSYKTYIFRFINIHPSTNTTTFRMNGSTDGGSNYNVTKTTSFFAANHDEGDTTTSLAHAAGASLGQSTGVQSIATSVGNDADENFNGEMWLFNPSNTTYVTHFLGVNQISNHSDTSAQEFFGGYFNTTSAINGIQFSVSTGTIESGTFALYGLA